jgi:hypothetical protein
VLGHTCPGPDGHPVPTDEHAAVLAKSRSRTFIAHKAVMLGLPHCPAPLTALDLCGSRGAATRSRRRRHLPDCGQQGGRARGARPPSPPAGADPSGSYSAQTHGPAGPPVRPRVTSGKRLRLALSSALVRSRTNPAPCRMCTGGGAQSVWPAIE